MEKKKSCHSSWVLQGRHDWFLRRLEKLQVDGASGLHIQTFS